MDSMCYFLARCTHVKNSYLPYQARDILKYLINLISSAHLLLKKKDTFLNLLLGIGQDYLLALPKL
jgi:hypothetical protein